MKPFFVPSLSVLTPPSSTLAICIKKHTQIKSTYAFLPRCHIPKYMGRNSSLSRQKKGGATVCNWLSRRGGVQLVVRGPQGPGYTTLQIQQILQYNSEDYYSEKKTSLMVLFSFFSEYHHYFIIITIIPLSVRIAETCSSAE